MSRNNAEAAENFMQAAADGSCVSNQALIMNDIDQKVNTS